MKTITNYTNEQLTKKIKNLVNSNFTKNNALNSSISKTITLKSNWNGLEYNTNVYLEKIKNPNYKYQISINSNAHFPYSDKGINQAVDYINNN